MTHRDQRLIVDVCGGRVNEIDMTLNVWCYSSILVAKCEVGHVENPSTIAVRSNCETLWVIRVYVDRRVVIACLQYTGSVGT